VRKPLACHGIFGFVVLAVSVFGFSLSWARSDDFKRLVGVSKAEVEKKKGEITIGLEWVEELANNTLKPFQQ